MAQGVPDSKLQELKGQGLTNSQIIDALQKEGFSSSQIFDALNGQGGGQSDNGMPPPPDFSAAQPPTNDLPPMPQQAQQPQQPPPKQAAPSGAANDVSTEEYVEAIIDEKWQSIEDDIQKIVDWKNRQEQRVQQLSQRMDDLKDRFDKLHAALIGKIENYDKNILEVGAELKAMEKVFSKVLPVFTDNVKQLQDVTERMKRQGNQDSIAR